MLKGILTYQSAQLERVVPTNDDVEMQQLLAARQGDPEAFELLFRQHLPLLRGVARRYFLPTGDTNDLVQEATIGFIHAVRDFDPDQGMTFSGFVAMCATRQVLTALKSATRHNQTILTSALSLDQTTDTRPGGRSLAEVIADDRPLPEDLAIRREEITLISTAIPEVLGPYEQAVVRLFLQGLSYGEIAAACGRSPKSVDNALSRIKRKMRVVSESPHPQRLPVREATMVPPYTGYRECIQWDAAPASDRR